jgi:hypothetical protein
LPNILSAIAGITYQQAALELKQSGYDRIAMLASRNPANKMLMNKQLEVILKTASFYYLDI